MDLNALKAKVKALEEGKPKSRKWKPKDKHTARLLPLLTEEDLALIIKWHYGVDGGRAMACPSTWGDQCDFCDLGEQLRSWKDENGKDKSELVRKRDWEWFRKISAAVKHYAPMVEKVEKNGVTELQGPFLWEMTPKSYTALLKICTDDDWNATHKDGGGLKILTSTSSGLDLTVELKKAGEKGNQTTFDLTSIEPRKIFTPLSKDGAKAIADIISKIPTADDIAARVTSEQASKVFAAWKASLSSAPAEGDGAGSEYGDSGNGETVATGGKSVDETVAKLESLLAK